MRLFQVKCQFCQYILCEFSASNDAIFVACLSRFKFRASYLLFKVSDSMFQLVGSNSKLATAFAFIGFNFDCLTVVLMNSQSSSSVSSSASGLSTPFFWCRCSKRCRGYTYTYILQETINIHKAKKNVIKKFKQFKFLKWKNKLN